MPLWRNICPHFFAQDPLSTLERDLALQLQIAEASRCLSREENLTKQVRKRRKSAVLKEEKKLKELEQALVEHHLATRHSSQLRASAPALGGEGDPSGDRTARECLTWAFSCKGRA